MAENKELAELSRTDKLSQAPVTEAQAVAFFEALEEGQTVRDAASMAGFSRQTGYRLLQRYQAKLDGVKHLLATNAYKAAENWVKACGIAADKGDHRPAKDLLQTVGAVAAIGDHGVGITINIGTPERPISAQILELSPGEKI